VRKENIISWEENWFGGNARAMRKLWINIQIGGIHSNFRCITPRIVYENVFAWIRNRGIIPAISPFSGCIRCFPCYIQSLILVQHISSHWWTPSLTFSAEYSRIRSLRFNTQANEFLIICTHYTTMNCILHEIDIFCTYRGHFRSSGGSSNIDSTLHILHMWTDDYMIW